ncbi:hypothetical protein [Streptomyces sp. NPDC050738]|uniref:hypothetical protein n=1 Tax=Streptomyces sp. NPDC050738 TaxID=3154744 RepID=UPI0034488B46
MIISVASHRDLVHQVLNHTRTAWQREAPYATLAERLHHSARAVLTTQQGGEGEVLLHWITAETAVYLLAAAGTAVTGPTDPRLDERLARLNRVPEAGQRSFLASAAHDAAPAPLPSTAPPAASTPRRARALAAPTRQAAVGGCPCACAHGGQCGGCGHAGCGGRS